MRLPVSRLLTSGKLQSRDKLAQRLEHVRGSPFVHADLLIFTTIKLVVSASRTLPDGQPHTSIDVRSRFVMSVSPREVEPFSPLHRIIINNCLNDFIRSVPLGTSA